MQLFILFLLHFENRIYNSVYTKLPFLKTTNFLKYFSASPLFSSNPFCTRISEYSEHVKIIIPTHLTDFKFFILKLKKFLTWLQYTVLFCFSNLSFWICTGIKLLYSMPLQTWPALFFLWTMFLIPTCLPKML